MWITDLHAEGFSANADLRISDLGRVAALPAPPLACEQVAQALQLFFSALLPQRVPKVLSELGFDADPAEIEVLGEPLPDQASWSLPHGPRALLASTRERNLRVKLAMKLDPLQFRFLREHAGRYPWLVTALAEGARAEVKVGWLFNRSLNSASIAVLSVVIGEERVAVAGSESPPWLPSFLRGLALRFRALPAPGGSAEQAAGAWLEARESPDPHRNQAAARVARTLSEPPFHLDEPRPVRWGDRPAVVAGSHGHPLSWYGPAAVEALELAAALHLSGAEILCLRHPGLQQPDPATCQAWLASQATEPGSPLEQVVLLGSDTGDCEHLDRAQA